MNHFFLDASALAKRYSPEPGSARVDRLLDAVSRERQLCLMIGVAEVVSVLVRMRNLGRTSTVALQQSIASLWIEVVDEPTFLNLEITNGLILDAVPLIQQHSLNATDSALLRAALDLAADLRSRGDDLVLVASDHRLLRAAQSEGLVTFDPEVDDEARLDELIGA